MTRAEEERRFRELSVYGARGLAELVISLEKALDRRRAPRPHARRLLERAAAALGGVPFEGGAAQARRVASRMKLAEEIRQYLAGCEP